MNFKLKDIELNLQEIGHVKLGKEWCTNNLPLGSRLFPYSKIYFPIAGSGTLIHGGWTCEMKPGEIFLIPSMSDVIQKCDGYLEKYYMHFSLLLNNVPIDHFLLNPGIMEIHCDDFLFMRRLFELAVQGHSGENGHSGEFERNAAARLIVSRFLQNSRLDMNIRQQSVLIDLLVFINTNLDRKLTLGELARHSGFSTTYLSRIFREKFHMPLFQYIDFYRTVSAIKYLFPDQYSIGEIADLVGYTNVAMFSKSFKKHMGMSPSVYREYLRLSPKT